MTARHARLDANPPAKRSWPSPRGMALSTQGAIGRRLSVRWKLTLWYSGMLALTLLLIGLSMDLVVSQQLHADIDNRLRDTADATLLSMSQPVPLGAVSGHYAGCGELAAYCQQVNRVLNRTQAQLSAPGQFEQVVLQVPGQAPPAVLDSKTTPGQYTSSSNMQFLNSQALTLSTALSRGTQAFVTINGPGGEKLRADFRKVRWPSSLAGLHLKGVLVVYQPEHVYTALLASLGKTLAVGIPLGVAIALLAGWWIARAALRPIRRFSRTVETIGGSRDLSRRLDFVGPNDEVGRLAATFDRMMGRLQKTFDAQKRFVADASHELRTPLTAIRGNADLLSIAPPDEREVCLTAIRRESERMSRMITDLLLLAEADAEEQTIHRQPVQLDDLLREVHRSATLLAGEAIEVEMGALEAVSIQGDPDRLKQLLLNLADNAVKFTPKGGTVSLGMAKDKKRVRISVTDSGPGVPPDEQEAIFQRFYRMEEARTARGSGLGLSICSWIAEAHGGSIELASDVGKGSTFTVVLPLRRTAKASAKA